MFRTSIPADLGEQYCEYILIVNSFAAFAQAPYYLSIIRLSLKDKYKSQLGNLILFSALRRIIVRFEIVL